MLIDFSLDHGLQRGLDALGLDELTDVQKLMIPAALTGQDLLVSAETGSGKTLAYLIPSAQQIFLNKPSNDSGTLVLVLVPTRELARQVEKHFLALAKNTGLRSGVIIGGSDSRYQISLLRKNPEFIIATPGRLVELIKVRSVDLADLQTLIVDEADHMLDMGFRDDVMAIVEACNPERQSILLSATLRHTGVSRIAGEILKDPQQISVGNERSRHSHIHQQMILADDKDHKEKLLVHLLQFDSGSAVIAPKFAPELVPETDGAESQGVWAKVADSREKSGIQISVATNLEPIKPRKTLVFSNKRIHVDQLGAYLRYHKIRAGVLHGELTQEERNHVVSLFAEGKLDVLVASDVAARGLDVKDIDTVINFDFPRGVDDYIHRIGRTGRAGRQGLAISFVSANDWNLMAAIERYTNNPFERRTIKSLKAKFAGPKKVKSSGKIAGTKKKKVKGEDKSASRHRNTKNKGKRKEMAGGGSNTAQNGPGSHDGQSPFMKKKRV